MAKKKKNKLLANGALISTHEAIVKLSDQHKIFAQNVIDLIGVCKEMDAEIGKLGGVSIFEKRREQKIAQQKAKEEFEKNKQSEGN